MVAQIILTLIIDTISVSLALSGYYGRGCTDACHLNPCENEAQCHRKPSSSHGYICDCGDNHYGQYCQHRYTHTHTPDLTFELLFTCVMPTQSLVLFVVQLRSV